MSKFSVEDTLEQSQRLLQESRGLMQRLTTEDSPSHYERKILELKEQIHNEQYMKNHYEEALHGLKERLTRLEEQDNINSALQEERAKEHQESLNRREEALKSRATELENHNIELHKMIAIRENPALKDKVNKLLSEKREVEMKYNELFNAQSRSEGLSEHIEHAQNQLNFYKTQAEKARKLEEEILFMKEKLNLQIKTNKELEDATKDPKMHRLNENTAKIKELENKLQKYSRRRRRGSTPRKAATSKKRSSNVSMISYQTPYKNI